MNYDETDIAERYNTARQLSEGTSRLWFEAITRLVPRGDIRTIADIGCGTGRFSAGLAHAFDADVVGVDPSTTMLTKARACVSNPRVSFRSGAAESLPIEDASVDLLFLSMVYHHLNHPADAAHEFTRVLRTNGILCIRNATLELLDRFSYLQFFPEAAEFNRRRTPSRQTMIETMHAGGFGLLKHEVVEQQIAESFSDYYEKISQRGLSDLVAIPTASFEAGLETMRRALASGRETGPVVEPIDLLVFMKAGGARTSRTSLETLG